jgi:hypothetical protein
MSMRRNAAMGRRAVRRDAETHERVTAMSRAVPSSLRPNLFSGD